MYDLDFKTSGADKDPSLMLSGDELLALYAKICDDFPVATIEVKHPPIEDDRSFNSINH